MQDGDLSFMYFNKMLLDKQNFTQWWVKAQHLYNDKKKAKKWVHIQDKQVLATVIPCCLIDESIGQTKTGGSKMEGYEMQTCRLVCLQDKQRAKRTNAPHARIMANSGGKWNFMCLENGQEMVDKKGVASLIRRIRLEQTSELIGMPQGPTEETLTWSRDDGVLRELER